MQRSVNSFADFLDERSTPLRVWWRDDDAGGLCPNLVQLVSISERANVPIAMAAVPNWLTSECADRLRASGIVTVLQHGWRHHDHARAGDKRVEIGGGAQQEKMLHTLLSGRSILASYCTELFCPVLVPPWNRIDDRFLPELSAIGYVGISTHRDDRRGQNHGMVHINTHVDVIDWRRGRRFIGYRAVVEELLLASERWPDEPIGLLTHHAAMDQSAIAEVGKIVLELQRHENVVWCDARTMFGEKAA